MYLNFLWNRWIIKNIGFIFQSVVKVKRKLIKNILFFQREMKIDKEFGNLDNTCTQVIEIQQFQYILYRLRTIDTNVFQMHSL